MNTDITKKRKNLDVPVYGKDCAKLTRSNEDGKLVTTSIINPSAAKKTKRIESSLRINGTWLLANGDWIKISVQPPSRGRSNCEWTDQSRGSVVLDLKSKKSGRFLFRGEITNTTIAKPISKLRFLFSTMKKTIVFMESWRWRKLIPETMVPTLIPI
jgi:hypothetical protein